VLVTIDTQEDLVCAYLQLAVVAKDELI